VPGYTDESLRVLASIMRQPEHSPAVAKPPTSCSTGLGQAHAGAHCREGEGSIRVGVRHIVQSHDQPLDAKVIGATPVRGEGSDEG
jgi:hypothetical protein